MLMIAHKMSDLSFSSLMTVYEASNQRNAISLYSEDPVDVAIRLVQNDFYQYLRECFFTTSGAQYAIWTEGGEYRSALRMEPYRDGYLVEALETVPAYRRQGYGERLMKEVLQEIADHKIYSHVHKQNDPSLKFHKKCGFEIISDSATLIDGSVTNWQYTLCYQN